MRAGCLVAAPSHPDATATNAFEEYVATASCTIPYAVLRIMNFIINLAQIAFIHCFHRFHFAARRRPSPPVAARRRPSPPVGARRRPSPPVAARRRPSWV
jgi:hypothetical protein